MFILFDGPEHVKYDSYSQQSRYKKEKQELGQVQKLVEPPLLEPHYSPQTLSEAWGWSADTIRDLFLNEPGVLVLGNRTSGRRRKYVTLRIPASVAERVHKRLSQR
jgi:hypothetical protein